MQKLILGIWILGFSGPSIADVLGFSVGAQYWHYDMDGQVESPLSDNSTANIDFSGNSDLNPYLQFEHPVPFVPNFKLQQNQIQAQGMFPLSDPDLMNGQEILIRGDLDFSHTDLMLYYEVLDNWLNLDLGLSFKYFDGHQRFQYQSTIDDESDFDDLIPMVYAKGQFDLPFTGFSALATVEALSFDSNHVTDLDLAVRYENSLGLAADLGYRNFDVDLKKINDYKSDMKADGFYLGVSFNF